MIQQIIPEKMWEAVWEVSPILVIIIVTIIATAVIVRKTDKFLYGKIDPLHRKLSDHAIAINRYNEFSDCRNHTQFIADLKKSVNNIERILIKMDSENLDSLYEVHSPRQLNETGREFYKESGADKILEDNLDFFISELEKENLKNALDVETGAYAFLLRISDNDIFNDLKRYIYNNPKVGTLNADISTACFVMSLVLRDEYLNRYPEI